MANTLGLTDEQLYDLIAETETGGEVDPFIRTKIKPKLVDKKWVGSSTAYGPVQMTLRTAKGFRNLPKFTKDLSKDELKYLDRFIAQGEKFRKYGNEDKKKFSKEELKEYDKYQYGAGGNLTSDDDKAMYKSVFGKALRHEADRAKVSDMKGLAEVWHGREAGLAKTKQDAKLKQYSDRLDRNRAKIKLDDPSSEVVTDEEMADFGYVSEDNIKKTEAVSELGKAAAIERITEMPEGEGDIDSSFIELDDMLNSSREELIDQGEQLASTDFSVPPIEEPELDPETEPEVIEATAPETDFSVPPPSEPTDFSRPPSGIETDFSKPPEETISQAEAAWEGFNQGITLGFSDEIEGAFDAVFTEKTYEESRDETRRRQDIAAKDWTKTYVGTQVAGGVVTSLLVPASLALKGAGSAAKISQVALHTAKIGAVEGGIAGAGFSNAEDVSTIAVEAAIGATAGAVGGAALSAGMAKGSQVYKRWKSTKAGTPRMGPKEAEEIMVRSEQKALSDREGDVIEQATMQTKDLEGILVDHNKWKNALGEENLQVYKSNRGHTQRPQEEILPRSEDEAYLLSGAAREKKLQKIRVHNKRLDDGLQPQDTQLNMVNRRAEIADDLDKTIVNTIDGEGPIGPIIKSELSDIPTDQNSLMAHAEYKLNVINFMKYAVRKTSAKVDSRAVREQAVEELEMSDRAIKTLITKYNKAKAAGRVTKDTFTDFKAEQNMAFALRDKIDTIKANILNHTEIEGRTFMPDGFEGPTLKAMNDPELVARAEAAARRSLSKDIGNSEKKLLDAYVMANRMDDMLGTNAGRSVIAMYEAQNRSTAFMQNAVEFVQESAKKRMKLGMSQDDLADAIEGKLTRSLSGEEEEVVEGYRQAFQLLLQSTNEAGASIPSRGKNYIPSRSKFGVEKITAFEEYYKKTIKSRMVGDHSAPLDAIKDKSEAQIEKMIKKAKGDKKEEMLFYYNLEKHVNRGSLSMDEIHEVFESGYLRSNHSLDNAYKKDFELGLAKERKDLIPEFLRERNVDALYFGNADATTKQLFISPVAKQLDASIAVAQELGAPKASQWMRNYQLDNLGMARKSFANYNKRTRAKLELWADGKGRLPQDAMAAADLMSTAIYGNLVGMNAAGVVRNLTQPLTLTAAEMGWLKGSSLLVKSYGTVVKKMAAGGWKNVVKETEDMGLKPIDVTDADLEGVRAGATAFLKSKGWKTTKDVVDKYTKAAMFMFIKSDEINRVVTVEMSKRMAKEIASGTVSISTRKAVQRMPRTLQNRLRGLDKARATGQVTQEEVDAAMTKSLSGHFIAGTQFIYGTAGKFELGRDLGPMFSMLTKWPVAVSSDMYYKMTKEGVPKGMQEVGRKYFAPLVVTSLLSRMLLADDERKTSSAEQVFVGKKGFQGVLPVHSVFSYPTVFVPVNVEAVADLGQKAVGAGTDALSGKLGPKKQRALKRAGTRATQQFIPVLGGAWKAYDRNIAPFMEEK